MAIAEDSERLSESPRSMEESHRKSSEPASSQVQLSLTLPALYRLPAVIGRFRAPLSYGPGAGQEFF